MTDFLAGVIEGFYGRPWSWQDRHAQIEFLASSRLGAYVYATKSDQHLRRCWAEPWPADSYGQLQKLGAHCRSAGIAWGLALSPFELYLSWGEASRRQLRARLSDIAGLQPDVFCVLFDDMRGDTPALARLQLEIVHEIAAQTQASRIIMCPTYYSHDPILEKLFGRKPQGYWRDLGAGLDPAIDFFWTGDRVCSAAYSQQSLEKISALMGRAPVLWDNYPANDGQKMAAYLHLKPFAGRPNQPVDWLRGHLANPMNQAYLSRLPLATLYEAGADQAQRFERALRRVCPAALAVLLARDVERFTAGGLDSIGPAEKQRLIADYAIVDHPGAAEVVAWLRGEYAFDPACLTG